MCHSLVSLPAPPFTPQPSLSLSALIPTRQVEDTCPGVPGGGDATLPQPSCTHHMLPHWPCQPDSCGQACGLWVSVVWGLAVGVCGQLWCGALLWVCVASCGVEPCCGCVWPAVVWGLAVGVCGQLWCGALLWVCVASCGVEPCWGGCVASCGVEPCWGGLCGQLWCGALLWVCVAN
ncbi:hypothetical protein O3P69_011892 [Scylla paramamosain]|uniref:Uncharacterized protein n=1 Tax=Scylla paramamosain TaxID=85552 RepID=A0AAW0SAZ1_SCYPA